MDIGAKIKRLRLSNQLTLEELANRSELTKGFLSQLERDLTKKEIVSLLFLKISSSFRRFNKHCF